MSRWSTSVRAQVASPFGVADWAGSLFAILAGIGLGLACAGLVEASYVVLDCSPLTFRLALGAAMLLTAVGAGRPNHLLEHAVSRIMARFGDGAVVRGGVRRPAAVQREALWLTAAVVGLGCGLLMLMAPWLLGALESASRYVMAGFLWSRWSLTVHDASVVLVGAVPFYLFGSLLRLAHRVVCPYGRWHVGALGWVVGGTGLGVACLTLLDRGGDAAGLVLRAASAPCFAAGALAAYRASPAFRRGGVQRSPLAVVDEPDLGERWPVVLRLAVAWSTVGALTTALLWVHVVSVLHEGDGRRVFPAGACLALAGGLGWWVAARRAGRSDHAIASLGMRCVWCGIAVATGAALFNVIHRASFLPFRDTPGYWLLWLVAACIPTAVLSYTVSYGVIAVMRRGAPQVAVGAGALRVLLLGVGAALLFAAAPLVDALGSYAGLVAVALGLLASGGVLIIHEPFRSERSRRRQLAMVFGAVVAMTTVMPYAGIGWLSGRQDAPGRLVESWWMSFRVRPSGAVICLGHVPEPGMALPARREVSELFDWSRVPQDSRVAIAGISATDAACVPEAAPYRVDVLAIDPATWQKLDSLEWRANESPGAGARAPAPLPALRWLRSAPDRYDIMVVSLGDTPESVAVQVMAGVVSSAALERLSPDGGLAVILPSALNAGRYKSTMSRAVSGGLIVGTAPLGESTLAERVVFCGRTRAFRTNVERWSGAPVAWLDRGAGSRLAAEVASAASSGQAGGELALAD